MDINVDRFAGEAAEPPLWGRCGYCGGAIYIGQDYRLDEGLVICMECAPRYAYSKLEKESGVRAATIETMEDAGDD